jgi:hypothetical protein
MEIIFVATVVCVVLALRACNVPDVLSDEEEYID